MQSRITFSILVLVALASAVSAAGLDMSALVERLITASPQLAGERARIIGMGGDAAAGAWPMGPAFQVQADKMGMLQLGVGITVPSIWSGIAKGQRLWNERERMRLTAGSMTLRMAVDAAMMAWMVAEAEARDSVLSRSEAEWTQLDAAMSGSYSAGKTMYMDRQRAALSLASVKADRAVLREDLAKSRGELNTMLAWPYDTVLDLALSINDPLPPPDTARSFLAKSVVRPEIRAAQFRKRAAESALSEAAGMYFPELMFQYNIIRPAGMMEFDNWMIMASVSFPLFAPFREGKMVSAARAEVRAATADSEVAAREIDREYGSRLREYNAAWTRVRLIETDLLPLAEQSYEAVRGGYMAGMASYEALSGAQSMLFMLQEERVMKRGEAQRVLADIVFCCGLQPGLGKVITEEGPEGPLMLPK